ncbi:hypothetical protein KILIM_060_00140, partial [Kineosphaera limosa NBRC 100340]
AGVAAGAVALAAGCGLPGRGPVQQGLDVGAPNVPPVRFDFEAPARGASPEQIVRGFLAASWSTDDDFRAARAYLTPEASRSWDPRVEVVVYPDSSSLEVHAQDDGDRVQLRAAQDAGLDASGRYTSAAPGSTQEATLGLAQASGEWRISQVPPDFGVWISRFYFDSAFRSFSVAYANLGMDGFVVDRRWFRLGAGLPTRLARALVEEPPPYLQGVVRTGFPEGTRLSVDSVPVEAGQALIDLSNGMLDVSADERRSAWAQALLTMRQAPTVDGVILQVSGRNLDVLIDGDAGAVPTGITQLGFTGTEPGRSHVLRRSPGGALEAIDLADVARGREPSQASTPQLPAVGPEWGALAARDDGLEVAAVAADGSRVHRWRGGQAADVPGLSGELTPPAYDREDRLWVGGSTTAGTSRIWAVDAAGGLGAAPHAIATPWLGAQGPEQLIAVRPAPDGQRILVVTRRGGRVAIGVSGVLHDGLGVPVGLTQPWLIGADLGQVSSATWVSNTAIAVIGSHTASGRSTPMIVQVGGPTTQLATVPDPRRITSSGGERGVVVVSGDGHAYGRVGGGWERLGAAVDIIVPGY